MHKAHGTQDRTWRLRSVVSVSLERQVRERCCWQRCLQCAWQAATYIGVLVFGRAGMQRYTDFTGRNRQDTGFTSYVARAGCVCI